MTSSRSQTSGATVVWELYSKCLMLLICGISTEDTEAASGFSGTNPFAAPACRDQPLLVVGLVELLLGIWSQLPYPGVICIPAALRKKKKGKSWKALAVRVETLNMLAGECKRCQGLEVRGTMKSKAIPTDSGFATVCYGMPAVVAPQAVNPLASRRLLELRQARWKDLPPDSINAGAAASPLRMPQATGAAGTTETTNSGTHEEIQPALTALSFAMGPWPTWLRWLGMWPALPLPKQHGSKHWCSRCQECGTGVWMRQVFLLYSAHHLLFRHNSEPWTATLDV